MSAPGAAGRVYFNNRLMNFSSAKEAMEHGFAMITEEQKANGLFLKGPYLAMATTMPICSSICRE